MKVGEAAAATEVHLTGGAAEVRSVPQTTFGRVWRPATMVLFVAAPLACPPWVTPALSDVFHAVEEAIEPRHVLETLRRQARGPVRVPFVLRKGRFAVQ